jgi:hypothetical protein
MRQMLYGTMAVLLLFGSYPLRGVPSLATSLASPAAAQDAMDFTIEGKISRHEPGKLTISAEGNIIFHVRYDDKTTIQHADGSPASSKDLQVGVMVRIEGELPESGEIIAHRITLL